VKGVNGEGLEGNVQEYSKTFENVQKLYRNIRKLYRNVQKLYGNIQNYIETFENIGKNCPIFSVLRRAYRVLRRRNFWAKVA
jgi:hypothetical protein